MNYLITTWLQNIGVRVIGLMLPGGVAREILRMGSTP